MVESSEHVFDGVVSGVVAEEVARLRLNRRETMFNLLNVPLSQSEARVFSIKSCFHDPTSLDLDRSIGVDSEVYCVFQKVNK